MDDLLDDHDASRHVMIDAFVDMTKLATRPRSATEDEVTELHGRFFNGNVGLKESLWMLAVYARIGHERELELHRPDLAEQLSMFET